MENNMLIQVINKLDGNNITRIVISTLATAILGYACYKDASVEISFAEKKITLNGGEK